MSRLELVRQDVIACTACSRLREYCTQIATDRRASFRNDTYWAKPVPGFGDPDATIVLVGLAPAAHGANRTGRMFTGDGSGGSGDFLMTALHAEGLANQTTSTRNDDGLRLMGAWMTAAVRCAPPDNKPTPQEFTSCHRHLRAELAALPGARVYVALGRLAFDACLRILRERGEPLSPRPPFVHGAVFRSSVGVVLIASYHPSRQNTHTGRLTPAMLREVFRKAKEISRSSEGRAFSPADRRQA